jgi:glycosyltransferase involved in cell wall biosynthesis
VEKARADPADVPGDVVRLLCVATLQPGKGHHILFEALRHSLDCAWHLTCAGSLTRDAVTAERVRTMAGAAGFADRVTFTGELDEEGLSARYDESDVFVLATLQETYGMAVAEAIAHGLPVVSTRCGAIPALVEPDGGLLVPPGDAMAFAGALGRVLHEPGYRAVLAEGARRRRAHLPSPENAVAKLEALLKEIDADV